MLDILVVSTAALLGYTFLRSYGGEGFTINAKFAPASTRQGKKDRIMALIVVLVIISAVGFVAIRQTDTNPWLYFGTYLLIGVVIVGGSILRKRK